MACVYFLNKISQAMRYFSIILLFTFCVVFFLKKNTAPESVAVTGERASKVLFQTESQGLAWEDISSGLPKNIDPTSFFYYNAEYLIGTRKGELYRSSSPESGNWTYEQINDPISALAGDYSRLTVSNIFPGRSEVYVYIHSKGIYKKVPGKPFWWPVFRKNIHKDFPVYDLLETPDGHFYIASESGLYFTKDMGVTWDHLYAESSVYKITQTNDLLLASTAKGLMRSVNDGQSWQEVLNSPKSTYDIQPVKDGLIAVRLFGPDDQTPLYLSTDNGQTWLPLFSDASQLNGIRQLEQMGNVLFCTHKGGISRSSDGGLTWDPVYVLENTALPIRIKLAVVGQKMSALMINEGC